jgi:60 kDa SS-A/Ro ribonucleoprotein
MKYTKAKTGTKTVNKAGGEAYSQTPELEFISILLTTFLKDQFYSSENDTTQRIKALIQQIPNKEFVAKAALYARNEFGMRSVSHVVAAEIARHVKGATWTKTFFNKIVHRPDDMMEILSYYWANYDKKTPNSIKKGFALALANLDEYKLAKYKKSGAEVSLVDVVNICHPKSNPGLEKLMKGTLKPAETWENKLSNAGKGKTTEEKATLKSYAWVSLLKEKKLGYFALLRNLRNIISQSPEMVELACEQLTDSNLIKKSLVLPFRFTTAMKEIEQIEGKDARKVISAISQAVDISCRNVPKFDGETLVVLDTSGSMEGKPMDVGSLFTAILAKSNDADIMLFSDDATYASYNPGDSTTTLVQGIKRIMRPGGTNFNSIFPKCNKKYDRIIILSDMQGWVGYNTPKVEFNRYKEKYSANPKIYSFDLQNYGTMQFPEDNVFCIAGWSDKIFDVMKLMETDKNALITTINGINI